MRKFLVISILMILMMSLIACKSENGGDMQVDIGDSNKVIENDIQVDTGKSNRFSEEEILDGIEVAKEGIKDYDQSVITKLSYDEEKSEQIYESQKQRYQEEGIDLENFMVIMSEFVTGDVEEGSPLNPNSTYEDYMWILKRADSTSQWVLYERGY